MNDPRDKTCFTVLFEGDLSKHAGNPLLYKSGFGKVLAISYGNVFAERDELEEKLHGEYVNRKMEE